MLKVFIFSHFLFFTYCVQNEQLKKAAIIRAEGEAEAARLISEGMKSGPGFIELRKIEALREIAETLAKSRNITYLVCT